MLQLENRYILSFYEYMADLGTHENVTLVRHVDTGHIYVKKILSEYNPELYRYLMQHPTSYYPGILEMVEDGGKLYLIEEYIPGLTLEQYLEKNGRILPERAKYIMLSLCEAVAFLHGSKPPIIHRDLKPSNIMLLEDDQVKIIDFNASRYYNPMQDHDTVLLGTQGYAAPEQYGQYQTDERTDIYALGVILNRMLTLETPAIKKYEGEASAIIAKCTDYYPEKRYRNLQQLIRDLRHLPEVLPREPAKAEDKTESRVDFSLDKTTYTEKKFPLLPPGFRTPKLWKALIACTGYLFILACTILMEVTDGSGNTVTGVAAIANRFAFLLICIGIVFFWGNYGKIQRHFPLCRAEKIPLKILGLILFSMLYVLIILFIVAWIMQF